jgi:hypothetical protein
MAERIATITHMGRSVLLADFSNLAGDQLLAEMRKAQARDKAAPDNSLLLTDITGCKVNEPVRRLAIEMGNEVKARGFRQAIVGVTGLQKVIFSIVRRDVYLARDRADALLYLTRKDRN